jgi:hypothetical protein
MDYDCGQTQPKSIPPEYDVLLRANYDLHNANSVDGALEAIQPCRPMEKHHRHSEAAVESSSLKNDLISPLSVTA